MASQILPAIVISTARGYPSFRARSGAANVGSKRNKHINPPQNRTSAAPPPPLIFLRGVSVILRMRKHVSLSFSQVVLTRKTSKQKVARAANTAETIRTNMVLLLIIGDLSVGPVASRTISILPTSCGRKHSIKNI